MFDYHMHTNVSFDGKGAAEEMVAAAEKMGLKEICFTDHADDDPKKLMQNLCFSMDAYSAAYDREFSTAVKVRRGMEFGMLEHNQTLLRELLEKRPFDFVIGSVHFSAEEDVYYPAFWENRSIFEAERQYLEDTLRCVQAHDDFDVLGHLTYLSKAKSHPAPRPICYEDHRELVDEILKVLVRKGKGMEINSSGVDRCGDFLPGAVFLRRFRELGGQIVTMGSDAHAPQRVGQYSKEACAILKDIFGYVCTFENRTPIFHKLP